LDELRCATRLKAVDLGVRVAECDEPRTHALRDHKLHRSTSRRLRIWKWQRQRPCRRRGKSSQRLGDKLILIFDALPEQGIVHTHLDQLRAELGRIIGDLHARHAHTL
jgi:hypothetical protein